MTARRRWALPLVPLYRAASAFDRALYRSGLFRTRKLSWPVISVGSLSAGGAGKTPTVIALANLLRERGWRVDVLSRGYGRSGTGIEKVDLEGSFPRSVASHFGDEPTLIAERTRVDVWVGADRFRAGTQAEASFAHDATEPRAHILDDAFQHRRLARDFDIVLVTAEDLNDTLLPAGNLREPFSAIGRADAIVLREEEREKIEARVRELAGPNVPLWSIRRTLRFPQPLGVFSAGLRPLAFCGIARPEGFAALLQASGCGIIDTVVFADHHAYNTADIEQITSIAQRLNATGFVTTEKDSVKLTPQQRHAIECFGPLAIASLDVRFVFEAPIMRALEALLDPNTQQASAADTPQAREALAP